MNHKESLYYQDFLKNKFNMYNETGIDLNKNELNGILFDFQKEIVKWALKQGKAANFAMTGLGKTLMQLEFARVVSEYEKKKILIIAPLAVSQQTVREANTKLNIDISNLRHGHWIRGLYCSKTKKKSTWYRVKRIIFRSSN